MPISDPAPMLDVVSATQWLPLTELPVGGCGSPGGGRWPLQRKNNATILTLTSFSICSGRVGWGANDNHVLNWMHRLNWERLRSSWSLAMGNQNHNGIESQPPMSYSSPKIFFINSTLILQKHIALMARGLLPMEPLATILHLLN